MGYSSRIILLLIFITGIAVACTSGKEPLPDCDIQRGPCSKNVRNATISFDLTPKPVMPLKELEFTVVAKNLSNTPERIVVDLTMPDMDMGHNEIVLTRQNNGSYTGQGIIVICPRGGRLWKATVWIPEFVEVTFLFNVQ